MDETKNRKQNPSGAAVGFIVFIPLLLAIFIPTFAWAYITGTVLYGYSIYLNRYSKTVVLRELALLSMFFLFVFLLDRFI
ncbi:hypothetical protein GKZ89_15560 [Bacillus mangrovi]|uniref:Uncharacterized protein n=1 Tax=Metabacillus mangrovi TaxID=1491830 RepID=A0A7X2S6Z6_9BACI|nr:hypothetical protein [Metabacillus mangrovi]MTH54819.1 hypothetical protein [Metabacillus mangrovi]